jgi:lipoprotein NlpI
MRVTYPTAPLFALLLILCAGHLEAQSEEPLNGPLSDISASPTAEAASENNAQPAPITAEQIAQQAEARARRGDVNGAIAGYSQAINLDPQLAWAYTGRGMVKYHSKYDAAGAIADFNQAIALSQAHPQPYFARGDVRLSNGDVDGAIADFTSAIDLKNSDAAYYWRAYAEHEKAVEQNDSDDLDQQALADLKEGIELDPDDAGYGQLYIWMIRTQDPAQVDQATRDLALYMNTRFDTGNWDYQIGEFLAGRLSERELFEMARNDQGGSAIVRKSEGFFYAGMKHLSTGDVPGAVAFFKQSLATGVRHGSEADLAQVLLKHYADAGSDESSPH